ncbi:siderophore-interacting protein [Sphingobacterium sp. LRF_L2]|uniref:siderophore-interacting protein n=1 Tax=Sphingobacterium sp. LRF_L2 TaxID=3369421 RepID=UPI003F5EE1FB
MEKPTIAKHLFEVVEKEFITPHYIRVRLRGEGAKDFKQCSPGANNKIFIPPAGTKEVQFASFSAEKGEWVMPDEHVKPIVRTYTHRGIDVEKNEIIIDFVNHGDNGPASSWARNAMPKDQLGVAMKLRPTVLCPNVAWYLLVGDATAIPVLSCILEALPQEAKGICIIEVPSAADIHPEVVHEGFTVQWVFNEHPEKGSTLAEEVKKVELPVEQTKFAYIACEYQSVKAIRHYFREELQWSNQNMYAFSYWKAGVAEDQSAQERREEKKQD